MQAQRSGSTTRKLSPHITFCIIHHSILSVQVIGCAVDTRASNQDIHHFSYPTTNGSSCLCYHSSFGAVCYAKCATGIRNYEIVSESGRGNITVQCSPGNYVLGCGIQMILSGEQLRTATVSSINSCLCHDRGGAICYAICGQFS